MLDEMEFMRGQVLVSSTPAYVSGTAHPPYLEWSLLDGATEQPAESQKLNETTIRNILQTLAAKTQILNSQELCERL